MCPKDLLHLFIQLLGKKCKVVQIWGMKTGLSPICVNKLILLFSLGESKTVHNKNNKQHECWVFFPFPCAMPFTKRKTWMEDIHPENNSVINNLCI